MQTYYFLANEMTYAGLRLIHVKSCSKLPLVKKRYFLGTFYHPINALQQSKRFWPNTALCSGCLQNEPPSGTSAVKQILKRKSYP